MQRRTTITTFTLVLLTGLAAFGGDLFDTTQASISPRSGSDTKAETMPALQGQPADHYLRQKGLFERVKASVEASRYEIIRQTRSGAGGSGGVHSANNPAQNLRGYFTRDGVEIVPTVEGRPQSWTMGMKLRGIGYGEKLDKITSGFARVSGNRIEIPHSSVTEWYVNKPEGIEQGFTVAERPQVTFGDQPLRVLLELTGGLRARLAEDGQGVILERRDGKQVVRYDHLAVFDGLGRSLRAWMELGKDEVSLLVDDSSAAYPLTIDPLFTLVKKLTVPDRGADDAFGSSVGISDETVVVGGPRDSAEKGSAHIFERNKGGADNWGEVKKLTASDRATGDDFGIEIAISGDTVIVGAHGDNAFKGAAYIFERNKGGADNWGEVKKLTASDGVAGDFFSKVAISGDTAVVGATVADSNQGSAYVFARNKGGADNWGQVKKLIASDRPAGTYFGTSVSISVDTVVIGAYFDASAQGSAYVFERNKGGADNWGEVKKLIASDGAPSDQLGLSVGISGGFVVVGAYRDDFSKGSAYIYERNKGGRNNWGELRKLTASDGAAGDKFGWSVGISTDRVVVGASSFDPLNLSSSESAYIFERNNGGADNWGQTQKLTSGKVIAGDQFGISVGISGGAVIVGARGDNSFQGAAYIFTLKCLPVIGAIPVTRPAGELSANFAMAKVSDRIKRPGR